MDERQLTNIAGKSGSGHLSTMGKVALAPMAGITDLPFRRLCSEFGAAWVTSEMITSDHNLWGSEKSLKRFLFPENAEQRVVQIVGHCPRTMAMAAVKCEELGAHVIDINMGCPAKKVCAKAAGSALLKDEKLVASILQQVVKSVEIPVTLKYRTGWCPKSKNACTIAKIAESVGIRRLVLHGRTRACKFNGRADFDTIAKVVASVKIAVFANGDIDSPLCAKQVLDRTGAAGVMIGRKAQGRPWLFREINHFLDTGSILPGISAVELADVMMRHLRDLHDLYGSEKGKRIARKHVKWYVEPLTGGKQFSKYFNKLDCPLAQLASAQDFLERLIDGEEMAA